MSDEKKNDSIIDWIEYRLPIFSFIKSIGDYRAPKNLSYLWNFGFIAGLSLVIQIVTGLFLAMHYSPNANTAFASVESIMRNVNYGWLLRYMHAVGASMFFFAVYIHIARALYYGSYRSPREMVWFFGIIIFLLMIITAFLGYVLPWGQMSFWAATVITNLFSALPVVGEKIVTWLWGGFAVGDPTLNRMFVLHYLFPFIIVVLALLHIVSLRIHGSNNPTGVKIKSEKDSVAFHPYYTVKDFVGYGVFLIIYFYFVFYKPNYLGHPDNYIEANPMVTPEHIVPEWYMLPFYAILRAIPSKLGGVVAMLSSILILFVLPWLDKSKVISGSYRPTFKIFYWVFIFNAMLLGYLGSQPPEGIFLWASRISTFFYFSYFLLALPALSKFEKTLPVPNSISEATK